VVRERLSELARAVRALPGWVLRRSGPMEPLTRRNQLLDVGLALGLALVAILSYDSADDARFVPREVPGGVGPLPPELPPPSREVPGRPGPEVIEQTSGWDWAGYALLLVLIAAPLIFRRRYPLSTLWAVLVTATMVAERPEPLRLSFYVCVIAAYSAAVYSPYRVPALASLPVTALLMGELQQDAAEPALGGAINAVPQGAVPFLILAPIAVAAWGLRTLRARADAEQARVAAMERESVEAVRRAAEEERARIARELHDVVTHNVSVMVIQAGAARKVLTASPEQAREALLSVEASGRAAMTELRHVMGLLTMDGGSPDLAPQPGMAELESLVGRVRDAGLPVELTVTGRAGTALPDGVDLAGYRVVQEALTNAVKHAAGASAVVRVDYGTDRLSIEVTDTGGRRPPSADAGSGRGLIGLRERLVLYGGTLQAGPRVRGGYRVAAVIPLGTADTPDTPDAPEAPEAVEVP
jgi:signal transduction histidine kinase